MSKLRIDFLDRDSEVLLAECTTLIVNAFGNPARYDPCRVLSEIRANEPSFYRKFFVAMESGEVLGIGGVKAADWASHTHILYLSAVKPARRGEGLGKTLIKARVDWVRAHFPQGRILVSTAKTKRYQEFGFREVRNSQVDGRHLMLLRFKDKV